MNMIHEQLLIILTRGFVFSTVFRYTPQLSVQTIYHDSRKRTNWTLCFLSLISIPYLFWSRDDWRRRWSQGDPVLTALGEQVFYNYVIVMILSIGSTTWMIQIQLYRGYNFNNPPPPLREGVIDF